MEKGGVIFLLLVGLLLVFPIVQAEEQAETYSSFERFVDNVKLVFSGGDSEVRLALEIREKEVNSAINNVRNQGEDEAIQNLERAKEKLQIVQEKVSLETSEEIKANIDEVIDKVSKEENLPDEFDEYLLEEEKTQLTAVLTEKTYEYCSELAKEDFNLMLKDEECNPETAPENLRDDLEKLRDLQERMFVQLMLEIRSCVDDPGTCNCEASEDAEQKAKCEKMVALALRCEYKEDESACSELKAMEPERGDGFAESFVPDFLMNLFREKEGKMVGYGIEPSDCVPEECWDSNDKPECRQYDSFKETKEDWDEYGNYIGTRDKCGDEGSVPTMKEGIPQCFDGDVFLEEKCGKITMVENKEGLINYIIENELNGIIGDFENKSAQRIYAPGTSANGTGGRTGNETWTIDEGQNQVENKATEMKKEMNEIKNQIVERTFAPGTGPGDVATNDVDNGLGDGGLKPEVKTEVVDGDDGLIREVKENGGGNNVVDNVVEGDCNGDNGNGC